MGITIFHPLMRVGKILLKRFYNTEAIPFSRTSPLTESPSILSWLAELN